MAMTEFDGKGGLTQIDTVTVSGEVVADFTHTPATGTYTVNSDCTGTFTINFTDGRPPVAANFVVVKNGFEDRHGGDQCRWKPGNNRDRQRREKAVLPNTDTLAR